VSLDSFVTESQFVIIEIKGEDFVRRLRKGLSKRSGDQIVLTAAQLRARFRKKLSTLSKEELEKQIQQFRLYLEHLTEEQERSDHNQKMLVYSRFLKGAQTWELEHACHLVISPLDFKRFGIRVNSKGVDFAITVKDSKKPAPKGREGHRMVIRRYMSEALAGIPTVTKKSGKTVVIPAEFLAWAERSGYQDRIPEEIYATSDACQEPLPIAAKHGKESGVQGQGDSLAQESAFLTQNQRLILEVLQKLPENQGRTAKQIADAIAQNGGPVLDAPTIKNHYIKLLRKSGYRIINRPGVGYFLGSDANDRHLEA
jgi:hypothetical protein